MKLRSMWFVILLASAACSKDKGRTDQSAAAPAPPPAKAPAPTPTPAPAGGGAFACETFVTADDVAAACGAPAAELGVEGHAMSEQDLCMRMVKHKGGNPYDIVEVNVNFKPTSPDEAKMYLHQAKEDRVVPVGDVGIFRTEDMSAGLVSHAVRTAKGSLYLEVDITAPGSAKTVCSDDGLIKLATVLAARLPDHR
jgi:hypothetical protein